MRSEREHQRAPYLRIVLGVVLLWGILQAAATATGSLRGEWGVPIAGLIVLIGIATEAVLFNHSVLSAARALGLGWPSIRSLLASAGLALALLAVLLGFALITGAEIPPVSGAAVLAVGIVCQGGVSEELIFRGFLFGHLRRHHAFWPAVGISLVPFVAVHALLFMTLPLPVAAASVALSVVSAIPLAHLFEMGRGTIWAPALLHAAIQGVKLVDVHEAWTVPLALIWMVASAIVPLLALLVPARIRPPSVGRST